MTPHHTSLVTHQIAKMTPLQFHQHHSLVYSPSSSHSSSPHFTSPTFHSTTPNNKKFSTSKRTGGACESCKLPLVSSSSLQDIDCHHKRRVFLFLGISCFPILPLVDHRAFASENEESSNKEDRKVEQMGLNHASANPVLSLLNAIGILSSGVLAALFSIVQKDNQASTAMVESLSSQLEEKKAAIVSLGKEFETKLSNQQDEHSKLLTKAKEEQLSLISRLESANGTVLALGRDLQNEKRKIYELQIQMEGLNARLSEAEKEKGSLEAELKEKDGVVATLQEKINLLSLEIKEKEEAIQTLSSTSAQKDSELAKLNSAYEEIKNELDLMNSQAVSLKDELSRNQNELMEKKRVIDHLNTRVNSLTTDRDNLITKLNTLEHEYDDLKSSFDAKAASDAKLLNEKEQELLQLKGEYDRAVTEATEKKPVISDLTQERDNLKKLLDVEVNNVKNVKEEIKMIEDALGLSRNEVTDLNNELNQLKKLCSELGSALSEVRTEFSQARESFEKSLNEAKLHSDSLLVELVSVKEALNESESKHRILSGELDAMTKICDGLKMELRDVYEKTEEATNALREEKKVVESLKDELGSLEKQLSKEKEARKSLEDAREEARRSLDEAREKEVILSNNLEVSKTQIYHLEEEKDFLISALEKEKRVTQEARENLEDAKSLVARLGSERQSLDKKVKKLEGDLASAKGEILKLRSKTIVDDKAKLEKEDATSGKSDGNEANESALDNGAVATTPAKRGRRRKGSSQ